MAINALSREILQRQTAWMVFVFRAEHASFRQRLNKLICWDLRQPYGENTRPYHAPMTDVLCQQPFRLLLRLQQKHASVAATTRRLEMWETCNGN
jgi:hypothetical protein